jgi:hypothetical protein
MQMGQSILEFKHTKQISAIPIQHALHVADGKHHSGYQSHFPHHRLHSNTADYISTCKKQM